MFSDPMRFHNGDKEKQLKKPLYHFVVHFTYHKVFVSILPFIYKQIERQQCRAHRQRLSIDFR
jgi:hypothetical protein